MSTPVGSSDHEAEQRSDATQIRDFATEGNPFGALGMFASLLLLSIALAMDATAVAAARGLAARRVSGRDVAKVALLFGGFQAAMPVAGYLAGDSLGARFAAIDHWIAFGLLVAIGLKMFRDGLRSRDEPVADRDPFAPRVLLLLAVATSIDALAAGVTLPVLGLPLLLSIAAIGVTTALLSTLGLLLGRRLGAALGARLPLVGGLLLIALGGKILIEHLTTGR
jgi:putative Mn2+ efflux pump MntP